MNIDRENLRKQFEALKLKGRVPADFDCALESNHIADLAEDELARFLSDYDGTSVQSEGGGGSSSVISAVFTPFKNRRAIKLPRKRIYLSASQADIPPDVDPEMHALSRISHKNITRLYDSFPLIEGKGFCYITEYVEGAEPLHEYARLLCARDECRGNDFLLSNCLRKLSQIMFELVDALQYMHETTKLLHFDVKPDNVLISKDGRPYLTDLGFARDFTKYGPADLVKVGFTWKYAHRSLSDVYHGGRVSETPARAKNQIYGAQLSPAIDLYAFGRTVQEVLKKIEDIYGSSIYSLYTFNYLHIVACLCLDGENAPNHHIDRRKDFVSDQALTMPLTLFAKHKFKSFAQVKTALERLLGLRRLEDEVPELDQWSSTKINASDVGIITFTPRINSILEHPLIRRLSGELQLGMLDTVYPTATHTRLQHSLGVHHAVTQYIIALYYDPDNPTFRVLFDEMYIKRTMLAALVHDIGQSTFGHEFEEINEKDFSHARIGEQILKCDFIKDKEGRSLSQIIEGSDYDCWGVNSADVIRIFTEKCEAPIEGVLHVILDGQLDADKIDFLIRDSVECRVPYGQGIDIGRFLRMLTTVGVEDAGVPKLRLAIKRKGSASAEAFALARYQLYQAVYWHHTFRAVKAMFITVARRTFADLQKDSKLLFDQDWQIKAYIKHVIGIPIESANVPSVVTVKPKSKDSIINRIDKLMENPDDIEAQGKYSSDKTIRFLWHLSTGKERELLKDLCERNYYKRVFEAPLAALTDESWHELREIFKGPRREELQKTVEDELLKLLRTDIQSESKTRESLVMDQAMETFTDITSRKHAFLIDLPTRGWTSGGEDPPFVSDYKRRYFRADAGGEKGSEVGALWSRHLGDMMRGIAYFRVFCEPQLHRLLRRVLSSEEITSSLLQAVPELRKRAK
jgi:serine/threonine protein kinase